MAGDIITVGLKSTLSSLKANKKRVCNKTISNNPHREGGSYLGLHLSIAKVLYSKILTS
jgi:hypothetical protein